MPGLADTADSPVFYLLTQNCTSTAMDVPKLDGLAVSFLLTAPESLDYPGLYESLVDRIDIIKDGRQDKMGANTFYTFSILWRLVQSLPPPAPFLAKLDSKAEIKAGLYTFR